MKSEKLKMKNEAGGEIMPKGKLDGSRVQEAFKGMSIKEKASFLKEHVIPYRGQGDAPKSSET